MTLIQCLEIVWKRKLIFLLVSVLVTGCSVAFCLLVPPIFQSEALLMVFEARSQEFKFPEALRFKINSQLYVAESDGVLRQAIASIGPLILYPKLREHLDEQEKELSDIDLALLQVKKTLKVTAEKDAQVVSLKFRHTDRGLAERFLTRIVEAFMQRQAALSGYAEAPPFFRQQASRYRDDYEDASARFSEFAKRNSTYSIRQEVQLALSRRDEAVATLAKTKASIVDKESQAATLQNTATQLRRRIALPGEITGPKYEAPADTDLLSNNKVPANESPLLLVRVFQETAQQLVGLNATIIGLRALAKEQANGLAEIDAKLAHLSSIEAEFDRLKSEVDQASTILETHIKRAAEAQMNADWDASDKLSSVKVLQAATAPILPVFPQKTLFIAIGTVIGMLCGAGVSAMANTLARRRNRKISSPLVAEVHEFTPEIATKVFARVGRLEHARADMPVMRGSAASG